MKEFIEALDNLKQAVWDELPWWMKDVNVLLMMSGILYILLVLVGIYEGIANSFAGIAFLVFLGIYWITFLVMFKCNDR